ncbi:MAG: hypothetical protein JSV82_02315 [Planctomycetota bacterium]|nr:MAG: hypothetical protein JSV82_02315 [Planctomycetota bacterium]
MSEEINEEVIEDKRRSLRFFCRAVHLLGWVLVTAGVIWFGMFVGDRGGETNQRMDNIELMLTAISVFSFDFFFVGLGAVILSQFARYVFDRQYKPGLMLRCGDKILYFFVVIGIYWAGFKYFLYVKTVGDSFLRFWLAQPLILPTVVKVLILIGLAQILKRILPVIEESKTLV